ncbi:MAG: hypothetical protein JHC87_00255 [Thermoleophilaceae bacterium]|nr:hypothetical protein [Thermoleophilaceae bacterium]
MDVKPLFRALGVWGVVLILCWVVGSVVSSDELTVDQKAVVGMVKTQKAMEAYRAKHGSYRGVTVGRLRRIDAGVPKELQPPVVAGEIYALKLELASGVTYRLARGIDGRIIRDCSVASGAPVGECKLDADGANSGRWDAAAGR